MKPFFAELRTSLARQVMVHAAGFVALVAPWLAQPHDKRMSRIVLILLAFVVVLGLGTAGYIAVEAMSYGVARLREEPP